MYRECWAGADQALVLLLVVALLVMLGAFAAAGRNAAAARKFRKLYHAELATNRILRRERSWIPPLVAVPSPDAE